MNVLYATDGREQARTAGQLLARLAAPHRADVTTFLVDELGDRAAADEVADATFAWAVEHLEGASLPVRTKRVRGDAKSEILRELDTGTYELVAMGVGNTGWLGELILGGVANQVLYRSSIPALVWVIPSSSASESHRARSSAN